eukprot:3210701-Pleurochrysis_carterae.AAC.1
MAEVANGMRSRVEWKTLFPRSSMHPSSFSPFFRVGPHIRCSPSPRAHAWLVGGVRLGARPSPCTTDAVTLLSAQLSCGS